MTGAPLSGDAARALLEQTARDHGPWTAHDIPIADGLSTGGAEQSGRRIERVLAAIEDFRPGPFDGLRILDLGALEGLYGIECARLGAEVVAVEARAGNVARTRAAVEALGLADRVDVRHEDVRDVSVATHGRFDVVLCLGILYHLDQPDVFRFIERLGELCTGLLVLDTHIALTDAELAALDDPERGRAGYAHLLSGLRTVHDDRGISRRGRVFYEHTPEVSAAARLASPWASVQPQSFWLERAALVDLLADAGFGVLYTPTAPALEVPADRIWLVGVRGDRRASTGGADRYRTAVAGAPVADPAPPPAVIANGAAPVDVVCFGIVAWDYRWQRPQQLLSRLAARGHRVFCIRPTAAENGGDTIVDTVAERVWEIQPRVSAPFAPYEGPPSPGQVEELQSMLRGVGSAHGIGHDAVAMVQLPSWSPAALAARAEFGWNVVYDCMDEWDGFPGLDDAVAESERDLLREADAVTTSALGLWKRLAPVSGNAVLVRNGGDPDHYADPGPDRPLADLPRPIIGFVGGIAPWVDIELVAAAARARPDWTFVFVGDLDTDVASVEGLANVRVLPRRPYAEMPAYVREFDVCMIPFRVDAITRAVDPVKIYEYFSLGKPVVTRPLPELTRFGDLLYTAAEASDFVPAVAAALAETDATLPERRITAAADGHWEQRVDTLLAAVARGRTRGYDRVRSWALGRRLHAHGPVVVAGGADDVADVVRLRPELLVPAAADPAAAGAVLALSLDPAVLERAQDLAGRHGLASFFALTGVLESEVPGGHRDLIDAVAAALHHQGLAMLEVERLMWDDPADSGASARRPTVLGRVDGGTRELLVHVAPVADPATVGALVDQIRHLRLQVDVLTHGG